MNESMSTRVSFLSLTSYGWHPMANLLWLTSSGRPLVDIIWLVSNGWYPMVDILWFSSPIGVFRGVLLVKTPRKFFTVKNLYSRKISANSGNPQTHQFFSGYAPGWPDGYELQVVELGIWFLFSGFRPIIVPLWRIVYTLSSDSTDWHCWSWTIAVTSKAL